MANDLHHVGVGEDELLTVSQAAEYYKRTDETVRRWIGRGILSAKVLPGGTYRIRRSDLDSVFR